MSMTKKHSQQLVYVALSRVIFNTLFNIIRVCRSRYVLYILFLDILGNFQSKVFNSYFSYHKPIVSFLEQPTIQMTMSQSKIYQSNLCTIIIIYCKCHYFMNIEQKKKTVVLRIMNLALMTFSLLPCGLKHTQFFLFKLYIYWIV